MIHVPDVRRTVDWYRDIGFVVSETYRDAGEGLSFAIMGFGGSEVMFSSGGSLSAKHRREVDLYAYTDDVDELYDRIRDRVEIVEAPHNMFYGMREVIIRDLNGFWITFGQEVPEDVITPWPAADAESLLPYQGKYRSEGGNHVLVTIQGGRLLAFLEDSAGVFLRPEREGSFTPMMEQEARVSFEGPTDSMAILIFEQDGVTTRFTRVQ